MSRTALLFSLLTMAATVVAGPTLTVHVDRPGIAISPTLYGIFFEEINRAGDGGIFAEMLENRSFEDSAKFGQKPSQPLSWSSEGAVAIGLDTGKPLNSRNPTALRADFTGRGAVRNAGFKGVGLALRQNTAYRLSLYGRSSGGVAALTVRLESKAGDTLAEQPVAVAGDQWQKIEVELTPTKEDLAGRLALVGDGTGSVWLDMVSLMPKETWKGHGLRPDLAELVAAMHPRFVRFPGGCFVEGDSLPMRVQWKDTIGDPAERRGNWCIWGYQTTGGFGAYEFFQWCEDLDAEPLYVINCGMSHQEQGKSNRKEAVPLDPAYVQDALDLIEYARGPADSTWGAKRAAAGHPAPFKLNYIEIGNENGGPVYHERYRAFYDAIKARYPDLKLIANVWNGTPKDRPLDLIDEHYYSNPGFFQAQANRYDGYQRGGTQIYVGEYAVTKECGQGNLAAALGEAAFMTGMERNSDVVAMCSYAPLFVNPPWRRWNPNAIVLDQARAYGTPSYHVQCLFAANLGQTILPVDLPQPAPGVVPVFAGAVGIGTWATRAEYKDLKVEKDGQVLFAGDPAKGLDGWRKLSGDWQVNEGAWRQTGGAHDCRLLVGDKSWTDYSFSLKARKLGGAEGFLILFGLGNDKQKCWWNLGGWGNSRHGVEMGDEVVGTTDGAIETGRWYDIRIELKGATARCYLDGKQVHEVTRSAVVPRSLFAVASRDERAGEIIVKVVNSAAETTDTLIQLPGATSVGATATAIELAGNPQDENSFEQPAKVAPRVFSVPGIGPEFRYTLPPHSVTVLRIKAGK